MDLVIRNATIAGESGVKDIGIREGKIVKIMERIDVQGVEEVHAQGNLVSPGFVNSHMHLDKALILERYDWSEQDFVQETFMQRRRDESNKLKKDFTVEDVCDRSFRMAQMCAVHGTTALRTHAEVDSVVGVTDVEGVLAAKEASRDFMDIQVDVFPVVGFEEMPEVETLMRQGLELGGDLVGGDPEIDSDGSAHVDRVFALAKEYDKDIDFHVDQGFSAETFNLPYIAEKTIAEGWEGRVCWLATATPCLTCRSRFAGRPSPSARLPESASAATRMMPSWKGWSSLKKVGSTSPTCPTTRRTPGTHSVTAICCCWPS